VRQLILIRSEHVHGEIRIAQERRQAARFRGQTPQHHGRLERYRIEAVRGKAHITPGAVAGGNNGDTGGERTQCFTETSGIGR
jgi:hypothetical protein